MRRSPPITHDGSQPPIEGLWVRYRNFHARNEVGAPVQVRTNARSDAERGRVQLIPNVLIKVHS